MRRLTWIAVSASVALAFAAVSPARAQLVPVANNSGLASPTSTITFSEFSFPNGTSITNQWAAFGVTFSGLTYNPQGPSTFPGITGDNLGTGGIANPFEIFFNNAQHAAAFGFATNPTVSTFTAFLSGVQVATFGSPTHFNGSTPYYFGFQAAGNETFDQIEVNVRGSASLLDNLQLGNAVVSTPEPSSVILLATGLAGVIGVARRRRGTK